MLKTVNKIIKISSRESLGWERALSYELSMAVCFIEQINTLPIIFM
jgi:hypothetical protein